MSVIIKILTLIVSNGKITFFFFKKKRHRKQMQKQQLESRPLEDHSATSNVVNDMVNSNLSSSSGIKRFIKRESPLLTSEENNGVAPVRINRAALLRAAATSATPPPIEDKSGKIFCVPFQLWMLIALFQLFRESRDCPCLCWKCRPSIRQTALLIVAPNRPLLFLDRNFLLRLHRRHYKLATVKKIKAQNANPI